MQLRCLPVIIVLEIGTLAVAGAGPQNLKDIEVNQWITAARQHEPGILDEHVRRVSDWPRDKFGRVLGRILNSGSDGILLRSATLLADISIHIPVDQRPQLSTPGYGIIAQDGQRRGIATLDSHLAAGRRLLDGIGSDPSARDAAAKRAHAVAWYRAVSAVLAARSNLADLQPHVDRSLARFPDSAGVLFDAGCFAEAYASPALQAPLSGQQEKSSQMKPEELLRSVRRKPAALLAEAERHFRAAVERDPAFTEARVRLGRVMTLRGRPAEAVRELRRATGLTADDKVKYFAYLFLGDALQLSSDDSGALSAFRTAAALFPSAQAPQLAIGRLAGEQGDSTTARAAIKRALEATDDPDERFDPWWIYYQGNGRHAEAMYAELAARMKQLMLQDDDIWRARR
ncbi:MAG TPA: tetratricopeptide repeat protein [Vicinamibacterales bacterium]|nr:tetratricopeptide repeat protein [Vicinamibacterales bacterium]